MSKSISDAASLKPKQYKRQARRGLAEAMLGMGVIIVEGVTEQSALEAVAEKLEGSDELLWPLDLSGVTIFSSDGDGDIPLFGAFFKALGMKTYAFYDQKARPPAKNAEFVANFDIPRQTAFVGIEKLLVAETPPDRQWQMLAAIRNAGAQGNLGIPADRPGAEALKDLMYNALKSNKGNGYAGELIDLCAVAELPNTISTFLREIYALFPKPEKPPILAPVVKVHAAEGAAPAGVQPEAGQ